jgi:phosphoglycerate kinase
MTFKTLDDLGDVRGKRALVRVDLNVPMQDGAVSTTPVCARRCRP